MTDVMIWTRKGQVNPIVVQEDRADRPMEVLVAGALRTPVSRSRRTPEGRTSELLEWLITATTSVGVTPRPGQPVIVVDLVNGIVHGGDGKARTIKGWIKKHGLR